MIVSGEEDGKPSPPDKIKGSQMTVDKKTIKLTDKDDKQSWILDYKLDASKKPAEIDMTVAEGRTPASPRKAFTNWTAIR